MTFLVNSTADTEDIDLADKICADRFGKCTLRAAIQNANKSGEKDRIHFKIPGSGPFVISIRENLPPIIEPVELDATTQPGYTTRTPQIVLSGAKMFPKVPPPKLMDDWIKGFFLTGRSDGSRISGFVLGGFGYVDYVLDGVTHSYYPGYSIYIETGYNLIQGNFIGISADGKTAFPNFIGIASRNPEKPNFIGGEKTGDRNVISGNHRIGLLFTFNTVVTGNYFGTCADGVLPVGNEVGISFIVFAKDNYIRNNLISGNQVGIRLAGENNLIKGNRIGTNATGTAGIANGIGVEMILSIRNRIKDNLISGNSTGIKQVENYFQQPQENHITGNFIGTDITGTCAIPNQKGIVLLKGNTNYIGGKGPGQGNLIAGNQKSGIELSGTGNNHINNNLIGTDVSGTKALPNSFGILFSDEVEDKLSSNNRITGNVISGNLQEGMVLSYSTHTGISGNRIGLQITGQAPLPNGGNGIRIRETALANCLGGPDSGKMNIIGYNYEYGLMIESPDWEGKTLDPQQLEHIKFFGNCKSDVFTPYKISAKNTASGKF